MHTHLGVSSFTKMLSQHLLSHWCLPRLILEMCPSVSETGTLRPFVQPSVVVSWFWRCCVSKGSLPLWPTHLPSPTTSCSAYSGPNQSHFHIPRLPSGDQSPSPWRFKLQARPPIKTAWCPQSTATDPSCPQPTCPPGY